MSARCIDRFAGREGAEKLPGETTIPIKESSLPSSSPRPGTT